MLYMISDAFIQTDLQMKQNPICKYNQANNWAVMDTTEEPEP